MNYEIERFVAESNKIEGIHREPTEAEVAAHEKFLTLRRITLDDLKELVSVLQPDAVIRDNATLNVRIGNYVPQRGGPGIVKKLENLLSTANQYEWRARMKMAYEIHCEYETLHPFMDGNGRSGRALWLWMMDGNAPLGFLHHWYYQSLDALSGRGR